MSKTASMLFAVILAGAVGAAAQTPEQICKQSTWANCGMAVKKALDANPKDPRTVLSLALAWGQGYDRRFEELRAKGKVQGSTPDSDRIFGEVKSHLNPADIAREKAIEALLKEYLPRVATVLEWANKPVAEALKAFFDSSEIASDYDELRLMNDPIQQKVALLLADHLQQDWKSKFQQAVTEAAPALKRP